MDIETILTILIILLPVAAKLIDKLLKSAGKNDFPSAGTGPVQEMSRNDGGSMQEAQVRQSQPAAVPAVSPVHEASAPAAVRPIVPEGREDLLEGGYKSVKDMIRERQSVRKAGQVQEKKKSLVLDKRNLVIYSEIMTPKYRS